MSEAEEGLYAELLATGSSAWAQLQQVVTSQLDGTGAPARRHRADAADGRRARPGQRTPTRPCARPRYDAEMAAWPTRRRHVRRGDERRQGRGQRREPPARLGVAARRVAVRQQRQPRHVRRHARRRHRVAARLPALDAQPRRALHGHDGGAALVRPRRSAARSPRPSVSWDDGLAHRARRVRRRTAARSPAWSTGPSTSSGSTPARDRARRGGAFCMPFVDDRSLVLLNWSGSVDVRADHRARAGPRLPQHPAGPPHAAAAARCRWRWPRPPASSARRSSSRKACSACRARAPGAARHRPAGLDPGGGRHPQPLPVRDRGVRPPPAPHARRQRAERADAAGAGRGLRRRPRPVDRAPVHVGA